MTIYNGYCTRDELLRVIMGPENSQEPNAVDDEVLDDIITDASRAVDTFCARQFYATSETLYANAQTERLLWLGRDVLAVQGASNGSGTLIAAGNYYLWPKGANSYAGLMLTESASTGWYAGSSGDTEGVISIAASVGYVDRAASAASSPAYGLRVIAATRRATLIIAADYYRKRFGYHTVTQAGIAYSAKGLPKDAVELLEPFVRHYT
jgi:hypothetical protein